ncbi:MAG TPA: hypothetical protein VF712_10160 [Thermoleophilaceae bacterium]|jgi:hypothetical protein
MKTCLNCKTENPDDAKYCQSCRFTLDWEATPPQEAADITKVLPPPTLELAIGPGQARVTAGNQVAFGVRVVNRGGLPGRARLSVAGPVASYATVSPAEALVQPGTAADATLTVAVPAGVQAGTVMVDVYATEAGGSGASIAARALLTIDPPPPPPGPRLPEGRSRRFVPVAAVAAVVAAGGIGYSVLSDEGVPGVDTGIGGGVSGRVRAESGLCLRDGAGGDRLPPEEGEGGSCHGLEDGTEIDVDCAEGPWLRLNDPEGGRFVFSGNVELDEEPPPC